MTDKHALYLQNDIVSGWDVANEAWNARQEAKTGLELPWESLRSLFWLVKGEMTIVSGYSGHGKSAFVNHIALHLAQQKISSFVCSFELKQGKLWNRFFQYGTGAKEGTQAYMKAFCNSLDPTLHTLDLVGTAKIDDVLIKSQMLVDNDDKKLFIFDNLMMLDDATKFESKQQEIVRKLLAFAQKNNVHVILVAHPRKPETYNITGNMRVTIPPNMYDVAGTSNMVNMVDNHISVTRNDLKIIAVAKQAKGLPLKPNEEEALLQGDAIIIRDKNRDVGENFIRFLQFCKKFQRLCSHHTVDKFGRCNCTPYFEYSKVENK